MTSKWLDYCVIGVGLLGGFAIAVAEERQRMFPTDYYNIKLAELISTYKLAYLNTGFLFRQQSTTVIDVGTKNLTRLVFEFPDRVNPRKKSGAAAFVIVSPRSSRGECSPCSLHLEMLSVDVFPRTRYSSTKLDPTEHHDHEYVAFLSKMEVADREANAQVRAVLGKGHTPSNSVGQPMSEGAVR